MLYGEFLVGTNCKDNDHNYNVYKELEIIYMHTDCTKEHIYEMGKKLVDNSKTEEQLQLEQKIKAEIEECKRQIEEYKGEAERYRMYLEDELIKTSPYCDSLRESIKRAKAEIKACRATIKRLKWVITPLS